MGPDNEEAGERVEGVRALSTFAVLGEERDGGREWRMTANGHRFLWGMMECPKIRL